MLLERTSPQQSCEECFDSNIKIPNRETVVCLRFGFGSFDSAASCKDIEIRNPPFILTSSFCRSEKLFFQFGQLR